jgi:hypothetical protein
LTWEVAVAVEADIRQAVASCAACGATYPVKEGIGVFLIPDLPQRDLWDQVDNRLLAHLEAHPEVEQALMAPRLESLNPADQFYRAMVLETRGDISGAKLAEQVALRGMYDPAHQACLDQQLDYVVVELAGGEGPIVDLASGRGYLVEALLARTRRPIVVTDFSPTVLRRNQRWLQSAGLTERVSLLAFDARLTPFKDSTVETLTTNQGLPNIEKPGDLLAELRRVVAGTFYAISHFYPEDDIPNGQALEAFGLEQLLYERSAHSAFTGAGWTVQVENRCAAPAHPTPKGEVIAGAVIDGLPVEATTLDWCVLVAK